MRGIMDVGTRDGKATEITLVVLDGYEIREQLKASGYLQFKEDAIND